MEDNFNNTSTSDYNPNAYTQSNQPDYDPLAAEQQMNNAQGYGYTQDYNQNPYGAQGYDQGYNNQGYYQAPYGNQGYYGQTYNYTQSYTQPVYEEPKKGNTKAILALICGILSLILGCCGLGCLISILGIVLAILSRDDNGGKMNAMAIVGLICSILSFVYGLPMFLAMVFSIVSEM